MSQANKTQGPAQAQKAVSASSQGEEEMKAEYDFRGGVRGKYAEKYRQGTNVVLLEPDVAAVFHGAEAVNRALRMLMNLAKEQASPTPPVPDTHT